MGVGADDVGAHPGDLGTWLVVWLTFLEFSWLGVDAVAEGIGAVLHSLSDESRGDKNTDFLEFVRVVTRCGAQDDVGTADVGGVVCVSSRVVRVPLTRSLKT